MPQSGIFYKRLNISFFKSRFSLIISKEYNKLLALTKEIKLVSNRSQMPKNKIPLLEPSGFKIIPEKKWRKMFLWYSIATSILILIGLVIILQIQPQKQDLPQNITTKKDSLRTSDSIIDVVLQSPICKKILKPQKTGKTISSNEETKPPVTSVIKELEPIEIVVDEEKELIKDQPLFMYVEEIATFQGGDLQKFQKYILENFKISESVKNYGASGKIIAKFIVDANGKVGNIKIIKGLNFASDSEMVRVLQNSPSWKPAKQRGKNVPQQFILPLSIDLKTEQ
jgi:hypothetical protein